MDANPFDQFGGNTATAATAPATPTAPAPATAPEANPFDQFDAAAQPSAQAVPSEDAIKAELTSRLQSGQDPKQIVDWLTSIGRPPDKATIDAINANRGNPSPDVHESIGRQLLDNLENDVAGVAQGAAALPDMAASGVGKLLSAIPNIISYGLSAAGHDDAAKWIQENITHPLANPFQAGDAIESVAPTPNTTAGHVNRLIGNLVGAAVGTPTAAIENTVTRLVGEAPKAVVAAAPEAAAGTTPEQDAAQAAQDLDISLPKFALSDADRAKAGALEQTPFGRAPIAAAKEALIDTSEAERNKIATDTGTVAGTSAQLGDQTLDAAVKSNKARRAAIGDLYDYANSMSAGTQVAPTQTMATLDSLLSDEGTKIGGSKIAPVLQSFRDDLGQLGTITVQQARDLRTNLREQLTNEAASTPSNADRITNQVMSAVNADMQSSLPPDAFATYKQADAAWAQQRDLEDNVLKPFLGKDFDNWGEQVAAKINADAKGNGTRLARFLSSLPSDQANNVRATIIQGLGKAKVGAQNAEGDGFSLSTFLTNWNQLSGARRLIFPSDTVQALDKLAQVADVAKRVESLRNTSRTGSVISHLLLGGETSGAMVGFMTGHPREAAAGLLLAGLTGVRQFGAAKLLADPDFAARLAKMPMNPKAVTAYWSRPWVRQLQLRSPAIASELQQFQQGLFGAANDTVPIPGTVAASPEQQQSNQSEQ